MLPISKEKLLELNQIGLIAGPDESLNAFEKRVDYCLHLKEHLPEELKGYLSEEHNAPEVLSPALHKLKQFYDCAPHWTPLFFSSYKLPFWQGGCAWIFQMAEDQPTSSFIQLRQAFSKSVNYLGIYHRDELLAHELSHVGRMMFQEPKFEELLAYRTANSRYRKWLGPIVQSSIESALFLLLILILVIFDAFLITLNQLDAYFLFLWLKIIPILLGLAALIRLWKRQKTFQSCIQNLTKCVTKNQEEAVAYRLKDNEIERFSHSNPEDIYAYAILKKKEEVRWQIIFEAYFIEK